MIVVSAMASEFAPDRTVHYKTADGQDLHLHVFEPAERGSDPVPGAVLFFGGGWNGGTPTQMYPFCAALAKRGVVACAAEYRTKKTMGRDDPFACVADAKSAVRYVRAHAGEWGVDPERMIVGGGSAGGHIAAASSLIEGGDDPNDDLSISAQAAALLLYNPVIDQGPGGYGHERLGDRWREISPLHHVTAAMPPSIFFLGTEDQHVSVATGEAFRDAVQAAGGRCDLHLYDGQGHGFFNHPFFRRKNDPALFADIWAKSDAFLVDLGLLSAH
jgi:acetyl esterase/lipase